MSKTIDERVVEMRFDNKNFEANVQTSMSTIEKLKRSLNFSDTANGFDKLSSAASKVDMSGLSDGVETVRARFSALQVVAITALANITNSAINAGKNLVSSLTIDQVTAGWSKYEQKTASVQTIMNATGKSIDEVNGYLDKLMWYSDETSYGFTDMTQSLGQLTSAGGDIEKLIPMIEGIANATAFAGKGANEFSRAIYNLNQSYSAGYLQYMDWKSLDLAGVSSKQLKQTFIDTAKALGKLDAEGRTASGTLVELGNFGQTLQDKWADTEVMEAAFGKWAELTEAAYKAVQAGEYDTASEAIAALASQYDEVAAKGFSAAQEAKSFTEAIESTKDAVSSGWMKTSELIFGNYQEAKKTWTELANGLWDVFASGGEKRNEILSEALNSKWSQFTEKINEAGLATEDFQSKLSETAAEHGIALDDLINEYGSLEAAIGSGKISTGMIVETLKKFVGVEGEFSKSTENATDKLEKFQKIVDQVWRGDFGNGADRVRELTEAGYDYATVQDLVNKTVDGHRLTLDDLSDAQLENMGYTEEQVAALRELAEQAEQTGTPINELIESLQKPSGRELLIDSFRNILSGIATTIQTVKEAWGEIFNVTPEGLYNTIEAFHDLSKSFRMSEETADKLKRSLKGVFAVLDIVATIVGSVLKTGLRVLGTLFTATTGTVLDLTASVGDSIVAFRDWFKEHNLISAALDKLGDVLVAGIKTIKKWIDGFKDLPIVKAAVANLTNAFSKLGDIISRIANSRFVTFIRGCVTAVSDWLKESLKLEKVQKILSKLKDAFEEIYKNLKEYFGEGLERIVDFIDRCKELDGISLENLKAAFKDFRDNVFDYFFNFDAIKTNISNFVESVVDGFWNMDDRLVAAKKNITKFKTSFTTGLFESGGKLDWFKEKLLGLIDIAKEKLPSLFALASAAILIKSLDKIAKALDILATPLKAINTIASGVATGITKIAKALSFKAKAAGVRDMAIAIGILAASLWVLSKIPWKSLLKAVAAMAALVGMLSLLALSIGKIGNLSDVGNLAKASLAFLSLAGALIIMAGALKIMESLDMNKAFGNATILVGLAIALGTAVGILNKLSGGKAAKSALALVGMAVAIKILVSALVDLDSVNFNHLGQSILTLISIIGMLGTLALASSFVGFGTGLGILGLVIGLKMFISVFEDIENVNLDKVITNIDKFKMVFGLLIGLMLSMALAGKNAGSAGVGILAMCAGILILTKAIQDIAGIDEADIDKGTSAISKLLFMFGILTAFSKFAGANAAKAGRMLVTASVAILVLVGAIYLLSGIDEGAVRSGVTAISVLIGMFSILLLSTAKIPKGATGAIITLSITIAALVAAVALLSILDKGDLIRSTACLSIMLGMFSVLIASTKLINTEGKAWLKTAATLGVLIFVVANLALVLHAIADLPAQSTIANAVALSTLLLAMSAAMVILGHVGEISLSTLGTLAAVTLVVAGLAGILYLIQDLPVASTLSNAIALSALILALSAACALLSLVPATGATAGIVALLEVFGAAGLIVLVASLLDLIPGIQEFMAGGFELLKQFASGLGEVIGSFVTGIGNGLTEGLADIADNLSNFTDHLQPFIEDIQAIEPGSMNGLVDLCTALLGISIAGLISMFTGKSLEDFATQLKAFGTAICEYSKAVSADGAINQEAIDNSITAANKLVTLANSVPDSGLIAKIVEMKDIGKFGEQLTAFGTGLCSFSKAVSEQGAINQEAIDNSITAGSKMVELANTVPDSSLVARITGIKNIGSFGKQLAKFGEGLCDFSKAVSEEGAINQDAITTSIAATEKLVELAEKVPDSSLMAKITGQKNIGDFGKQLAKFGEGIADYSDKVKDIDTEVVGSSITSANRIVTLSEKISGAEIDNGKIEDFGDSAEDIGDAISKFTESVSGDSGTESVSTAVSSLDSMIQIIGKISTVDTSNVQNFKMALDELSNIDLTNFSNSFGTAGQSATNNLSNSLVNGTPAVRGAVFGVLSGAAQEASGHVGQFSAAGTQSASGIGTGISSGSGSVISAAGNVMGGAAQTVLASCGKFASGGASSMTSLSGGINSGNGSVRGATTNVISGAIQSIVSRNGQFSSSGNTSMNSLGGGISKGYGKVSSATSNVISGAVSAADGKSSEFTTVGSNLMVGLKGGILSKAAEIADSAVSVVKSAINAAKEALGIASPSKVFAEIGRYTDEGFIKGLDSYASKVSDASANIGTIAIDSTHDALAHIGKLADSDLDITPTIRPVVDMDAIQTGTLNVGVNLNKFMVKPINSLSQIVSDAQYSIDASNREVVNAINDLRTDMAELYSADTEIGLYVDSKKLASSLAKPMNRQLNILSKRGAY